MKPLPIDISNDMLNIIIGVATLIIALTSFGIELGEFKAFKFSKSLGFRIPVLLLFSFIIIWATVIKDKNNDVRNFNDVERRDSLNQRKFNESLAHASRATASAASETMAKYYLKYDSVQHSIEKIVKDSSRKLPEINPVLDVCNVEGRISNDTMHVITTFCTSRAAAYNVKIRYCYVLRGNNNNYDNRKLSFFSGFPQIVFHNVTLPTEIEVKTVENKFYNNLFAVEKPIIYVFAKGSYQNEKGKELNFEALNYYNYQTQSYGELTGNEYQWIYNFIKQKFR